MFAVTDCEDYKPALFGAPVWRLLSSRGTAVGRISSNGSMSSYCSGIPIGASFIPPSTSPCSSPWYDSRGNDNLLLTNQMKLLGNVSRCFF